jgi:hypothetical protein
MLANKKGGSIMRRSLYSTTLVLAVIFSLTIIAAQSWSAERVYQMRGEVAAIDLQHKTVVVEVPVKGGKMLTVGGPLSTDALLKKDGRSVDLSDFHAGEKVTVKWKVTKQTHLILSLRAP